jgi:hypothetical protein
LEDKISDFFVHPRSPRHDPNHVQSVFGYRESAFEDGQEAVSAGEIPLQKSFHVTSGVIPTAVFIFLFCEKRKCENASDGSI